MGTEVFSPLPPGRAYYSQFTKFHTFILQILTAILSGIGEPSTGMVACRGSGKGQRSVVGV